MSKRIVFTRKMARPAIIPFGICRASETRFATNLDLVPLNRHGAQMLIKDLTGGGESFQSFVQAPLSGIETQQRRQGLHNHGDFTCHFMTSA